MADASQGSDFVVVANRLPVDLETLPDGATRWKRSPGGLVTALEPILRANNGALVGWPGVPDVDVEPFVEDRARPDIARPHHPHCRQAQRQVARL